jgi:hypothetical protein
MSGPGSHAVNGGRHRYQQQYDLRFGYRIGEQKNPARAGSGKTERGPMLWRATVSLFKRIPTAIRVRTSEAPAPLRTIPRTDQARMRTAAIQVEPGRRAPSSRRGSASRTYNRKQDIAVRTTRRLSRHARYYLGGPLFGASRSAELPYGSLVIFVSPGTPIETMTCRNSQH